MAYTLYIDHTKVNYTAGNSGRKYIVLHYTGNATDTARANANYFRNVNRGASAHYFVDASSVYEVVAPQNTAWAVGRKYGNAPYWGKCTNANSISIEMCSTGGKISSATFANAVSLTKTIMKKYGIPAANVIRHWDVCAKRCPGWAGWLPNNETLWRQFKSALSGSITPTPSAGLVCTYAVKIEGGRILPAVTDTNDYAGIIGKRITGLAIKVNKGSVRYRAHTIGGGWGAWVTGYNWNDNKNGWAGKSAGYPIDCIQVEISGAGERAQYRVSPVRRQYYTWQYNTETASGQDGYAGAYGVPIDRFQLT